MFDERVVEALTSANRRIVITGAGGWLGMATLDSLAVAFGPAFHDRVAAFGSSARELRLRDGTSVDQRPLSEMASLACEPTWVLHFAFLTKDRAETMDEGAYRAANAHIRDQVLAALDPIGVEAVFVASSGAAHKADDLAAAPAMQLYGALKAADEAAFAAWSEHSKKRAVITRIFNLTGPYINKHHAYALASFIVDGLAGRSIAVRAPRKVVRGYVAIDELMSLAFAEMAAEPDGLVRFDSGGEPLDLGEVARIVADYFPGISVERAAIVEAAADIYHGDPIAYAQLLARHRIVHQALDQQVAKTIDYLRAEQ